MMSLTIDMAPPTAEATEPGLTIDELAAQSRVPSRTIRFYQSRGALMAFATTVRTLADEYNISMGTAFQAYYHLEGKGLIESRPKSGYYVRFNHKRLPAMPTTVCLALTGASGMPYGLRLLECLLQAGCRVQLLYSQAAQIVARQEMAFELPSRPADAIR